MDAKSGKILMALCTAPILAFTVDSAANALPSNYSSLKCLKKKQRCRRWSNHQTRARLNTGHRAVVMMIAVTLWLAQMVLTLHARYRASLTEIAKPRNSKNFTATCGANIRPLVSANQPQRA